MDPRSVFIECEQGNLALLQSLGAQVGAYDKEHGGVLAQVDADTLYKLSSFSADFVVQDEGADAVSLSASAQQRESLEMNDELFDAYVAEERFVSITRVTQMKEFMLRAARRLHSLDAEISTGLEDNTLPSSVKQRAWEVLREQFAMPGADLRVFFSETEDYQAQPSEVRRGLLAFADALVGSAKDARKIDRAEHMTHESACASPEF